MALVCAAALPAQAQEAKDRLFARVFGDAVRLDPSTVARVKDMTPGERLYVDRDGDGRNDEVWYIDIATRHSDEARPLLVRVIDEDGDLDESLGPDLDSDLYVADWHADGTVDVLLDYQDNDGDNDLDEMGFYFYMKRHGYFGDNVLRVWWGQDSGDDNLLWYDVNYTYYQGLCQYRCHFSGDELVVALGLMPGSEQWVSAFENPFLFYDLDDDLCSEVVLRIEGHDDEVRAIRYSFDVDDDAFGRRTHDYDFSITGRAPEGAPVKMPKRYLKSMTLRGIDTQAWLQREHARPFVENAQWDVVVLTWDEMNANTEGNVERDPHERWEGIIAHPSDHFKQVGGPACSPLNKRNEVALQPAPPFQLYYAPADRRLHLTGAGEGWLHVDYDLDGKVDAKYTYADTDGDGRFDRRQLDLDADGEAEFDWGMEGVGLREFDLRWRPLAEFYKQELSATLAESQVFIDAAYGAVAPDFGGDPDALPAALRDPAATFFLEDLASWMPATHLGERMRETPAGARMYVDLVRDRMLAVLKIGFSDDPAWARIEAMYAAGEYRAAAELVTEALGRSQPPIDGRRFRSFTRRIPIRIDNEGGPQRDDWPVTLAVRDIKRVVADFNAECCAVVAPERWLDWREVPHQVDRIDPEVGPELSFLAHVPAGVTATYYLYDAPGGRCSATFPAATATARDWAAARANIAWESRRGAYRAYYGQFDFFGKKADRLILPDMGKVDYHHETEWGIDALLVGKAPGLGGLTLYTDGEPHLVQNPAGKGGVQFERRVLTEGPIRAAVEIAAKNVLPDRPEATVRTRCLIYAERPETEVRVRVTGAGADSTIAPGIMKLVRERTCSKLADGYFGAWGFQDATIDEIGMGMIVAPGTVVDLVDLPDERRIRCRLPDDGELTYWLIGDWRRGRQYPVAPTIDNWDRELHELADLLLDDVTVELGAVETLD